MKRHYRIAPGAPQPLTDAEIAAHRDGKRLMFNYHRALHRMHRRPLYRDPKSFLALLLIVLLAYLLSESAQKKREEHPIPDPTGQQP